MKKQGSPRTAVGGELLSLDISIMPSKMSKDEVWANQQKAIAERRKYEVEHAEVLEQIYQHVKQFGGSVRRSYMNCPCGKKDVSVWKIKQHICSQGHRNIFPIPALSHFVGDNPKPAINIDTPI